MCIFFAKFSALLLQFYIASRQSLLLLALARCQKRLITAMSFRATDRADPILPLMLHSAAGIWQQESAFSSSWQFLAHLYLGSSSSRNFKESPLPNVIVAFPDIAISAQYVTMRLMQQQSTEIKQKNSKKNHANHSTSETCSYQLAHEAGVWTYAGAPALDVSICCRQRHRVQFHESINHSRSRA